MILGNGRKIVFLGALFMLVITAGVVKADTITLHTSLYTDKAPRIDGVLDDSCWKKAKGITKFFDFGTGGKPRMKTVLKLCFDDKALYVGAILFENTKKMRAFVVARDDHDYWKDDSVEIYISPDNNPETSFKKFCVTPLGAQIDLWQHNGDTDYTWNGKWQVKTRIYSNRWVIEMAIPWSNFEKKPVNGDLWTFEFIRFAYSTGKLEGVTLSPGARHGAPGKFGLLLFENGSKNIGALVKIISRRRGDRWELNIAGGRLSFESNDSIIGKLSGQEEKLLTRIREDISRIEKNEQYRRRFKAYKEEFEAIPSSGNPENEIKKLEGLIQKTETLRWKVGIRALSE